MVKKIEIIFDVKQLQKDLQTKCKTTNQWTRPSLSELAKHLNISKSTLSRVINGGSTPDIKTFAILCEFLEVSPIRYFPKCNTYSQFF